MSARAANRLGFELADPDRRAGAFERFCKAMEASESYEAELARLNLDEVPMQ